MKKSAVVALLLSVWQACAGVTQSIDGVAAYVNDKVITVGDVRDLMAPVEDDLRLRYEGTVLQAKLRQAYRDTLESLIDRKLIVAAFEIEVKGKTDMVDRNVDRKIDEIIRERFLGDRGAFMTALKKQRLTLDELRKLQRESLIVSYMRHREVESRIVVSPREVRDLYEANAAKYARPERVHLRMIVIHGSAAAGERDERQRLAQVTWSNVVAGADFADCARKVSQDSRAENGGDWGWIDLGDLRKEVASVTAPLKVGEVSPVVSVESDYYILKLEARQAAGRVPFEEARKDIEQDLRRKETERRYNTWIQRLRKDAYVQVAQDLAGE
jgi:parvulin-like peptidyl-prolyl isomerase